MDKEVFKVAVTRCSNDWTKGLQHFKARFSPTAPILYICSILLVFGLISPVVSAQNVQTEIAKLIASDREVFDGFGFSSSVSGDRALVGAFANDGGTAYVYERQADGSWLETAILTPDDGPGGSFGRFVSLDGDRALVGAYSDDNTGVNSGSAYIFERQSDGNWLEIVRLTASDADVQDSFGFSVSLHGNRALIGAVGDDGSKGSAYVFEWQVDGTWLEVAKLTASDGGADRFGLYVSIKGDHAVVGAPFDDDPIAGENAGSAYVFERQVDGTWQEVAKLIATDASFDDQFGVSVAIDGNRLLVGAIREDAAGLDSGSVYVFERQGDGSWLQVIKLVPVDAAAGDFIGRSVSLDGDRALVGAQLDDSNGSAYLFERKADGTWVEQAKYVASDGAPDDWFGISVSLDGGIVLIGAEQSDGDTGAAYIFYVNPFESEVSAVIHATNSVWIKQGANILSGNVVVNDTIPGLTGPYLASDLELTIGKSVTTSADSEFKAHRIKVKNSAVVDGDVFYNELINNGTINGTQITGLNLPIVPSLPPFKNSSPGTTDIIVAKNDSISLPEGDYGDVLVKQNGVIYFTGNEYNIGNLDAGTGSKLLFGVASEVKIEEKFATKQNSFIGPASGSGIDASDVIFYVNGINGNSGNLGETAKAAKIGNSSVVQANFYVLNGTLWLKQGSVVTGAFLGKDVIIGVNVMVALDSFYGGEGGSAAKAGALGRRDLHNEIYSSEIDLPLTYSLEQNYPNPFNPTTTITLAIAKQTELRVVVYDALGRQVEVLADGSFAAGKHEVVFDASGLPSGTYMVRLVTSEGAITRKMMLMK